MSASTRILYTAKVRTTGGWDELSRSSDGRLDLRLTPPGGTGDGTNPEQLFAAGWAACFEGAMSRAARDMAVALPARATIDSEVDLRSGTEGFSLAARLNVSLPGLDTTVARTIIDAAHRSCPYSQATRGNIEVEINLI